MIKNILGRIFTVWGGLMFVVTLLIVVIPARAVDIFKEPKRTDIFIKLCRIWLNTFYVLAGIRVIIKGKENFEKNKNYVVVCNHTSMMDVPLSSVGIPGANKTIAKIEMVKIPVFGVIYKRGSILLDRKSDSSRRESYNKMKWVLEQGMHMCIYPEGTRNKSNEPLKSFQDGAFKLSFETKKPMIPTIITGTRKMLPSDKAFFFWPGKVTMTFLPSVDPNNFTSSSELKEHVFKLMWDEIKARG